MKNCWHNHEGRVLDDVVRFVGDEVAAVAAVSEEIAAEALGLPVAEAGQPMAILLPSGGRFAIS